MTFGLITLFENWRTLVGMMLGGFLPDLPAFTARGDAAAIFGIVLGLLIVAAFLVGNMVFVKWVRKKCGPFVGA
jgi:tetrahydromethanopterin S-methyltransferase subunit E